MRGKERKFLSSIVKRGKSDRDHKPDTPAVEFLVWCSK